VIYVSASRVTGMEYSGTRSTPWKEEKMRTDGTG